MKTVLNVRVLVCLIALALAGFSPDHCTLAAAEELPPKPMAEKGRTIPRVLYFSGLEWTAKTSDDARVGPGPNYFAGTNAWVDRQGRLHLKLTRQGDRWFCAEVISKRSFGFGTYRFYLDTPLSKLDANVVLGLFTWSNDPAFSHREIDIEFARWANADDSANAQFVVQPYQPAGRLRRFRVPPDVPTSTHCFLWQSNQVAFRSVSGHGRVAKDTNPVIYEWTCWRDRIPQPGNENVRMNLWLFGGQALSEQPVNKVIISRFAFEPLKVKPAGGSGPVEIGLRHYY